MSSAPPPHFTRRYRSLFLSDLHLGSPRCRADKLLAFLRLHEADTLYLVGDTFDVWHRKAVHWSVHHDLIIDLLCRREREGVKIVCLPGNHDPLSQWGKEINWPHALTASHKPVIHRAADHRRYLVIHGDSCDFWPYRSPRLSRLGSAINWYLHRQPGLQKFRRAFSPDQPPGAMAGLFGNAREFLRGNALIERRLTALAEKHGADGIICGHLHKPALRCNNGILYANCGDWVNSLSAVAEDTLGRFSLIDWSNSSAQAASTSTGWQPAAAQSALGEDVLQ